MPECRLCKAVYPLDQMLSGIGPRWRVCLRCGVEHALTEDGEESNLYSDALVRSRLALEARRWSLWFWLATGWLVWFTLASNIEVWGLGLLAILVMGTLFVPAWFFIRTPKYRADLKRLTP